jgi:hypothetical protein
MIILSHRGWWKSDNEKNKEAAFMHSFNSGYGTETDIRDYCGKLVISHDIADSSCMSVEDFFTIYNQFDSTLPLAMNIKADGLQKELKRCLLEYNINNYFVFDMSVPDGLGYLKHGLKSFTRQSEYEKSPSFYNDAVGVWIDEFHTHWITKEVIEFHIKNNKRICIVSPDLHKRAYNIEWEHYKQIEAELGIDNIMICTDNPEVAKEFFHE